MILSFNLQDFILRSRVLKLYREALRIARRAPAHTRGEEHRLLEKMWESFMYTLIFKLKVKSMNCFSVIEHL